MAHFSDHNILVFELGSSQIKAGRAEPQAGPVERVSTRVGVLPQNADGEGDGETNGDVSGEILCGADLEAYLRDNEDAGNVVIREAIRSGRVADWNAVETLLQHCFQKLQPQKRGKNEEHPILLSVPVHFPLDDWEQATQVAFERLHALGFYVLHQPLAAVYSHGLVTGLVIDIGHETTDITPVVESIVLIEAAQTIHVGGKDVEEYLFKLLRDDATLESELGRPLKLEDCRKIKESSACEIFSGAARLGRGNVDQRVPADLDGVTVGVGRARAQCMEVLFDPAVAGKTGAGLAEAIDASISKVELEKRIPLYENIVLSGGLSAAKGLRERLEEDMTPFVAASETANDLQPKEVKFARPPEYFTKMKERPQDMPFVGAQIVAQALFKATSERMWITQMDYNELGPAAAYRKTSA